MFQFLSKKKKQKIIFLLYYFVFLFFLNLCLANDEYNKRYNLLGVSRQSGDFVDGFQKYVVPKYTNYTYLEDGKFKTCHVNDFHNIPAAHEYYAHIYSNFKKNKINLNKHDLNFQSCVYVIFSGNEEKKGFLKAGVTSYTSNAFGELLRPYRQLKEKQQYNIVAFFSNRAEAIMCENLISECFFRCGFNLPSQKHPRVSDCTKFFNNEKNKIWAPLHDEMLKYVYKYGGFSGPLGQIILKKIFGGL